MTWVGNVRNMNWLQQDWVGNGEGVFYFLINYGEFGLALEIIATALLFVKTVYIRHLDKPELSFDLCLLTTDFTLSLYGSQLAVECIFCSACIRFVECCPQEGLTEKLWSGLENFVFDWLINADRVVSQVEYPSLVDLRGLLLDLVAQLLGALSRIRFSSVTERFFMELNTRRIDTSVARSETLSIINGMRYLKLGVCITNNSVLNNLMLTLSSILSCLVEFVFC
ncbi:uncharacterized protein LOC136062668 [Quercus suber]|uniref:uncharacterized protein LOC136062668 n=1 Tax=Quercus suber TaxID=58331 RepID=UPI0032DF1422